MNRARLLGVCERTFRRYIDRYEEAGLDGLIDRRIEAVSHRKAPADEEAKGLFSSFYSDRGSHDWVTPKAGGETNRRSPNSVAP